MFKNIFRYTAKHAVAKNGRYGYDTNLANNGGWLISSNKKGEKG